MNSVAKRVEDRRNIPVDPVVMMPDIRHRKRNVFGKRALTIDSDPDRVSTQVPTTSQAIAAQPADNVPFPADNLTRVKVRDVRTNVDNLADKLMPDGHRHRNRLLSPGIPLINVDVGAADARPMNFD